MSKRDAKPTSERNLEEKFEAGEDVLDYFKLDSARVIRPRRSAGDTAAAKRRVPNKAVVRESSSRYSAKRKPKK